MKYVWYASYGSNLLEERFLCYIRGGQPFGSTESEPGARDPSLPLRSIQFLMPYTLYFAKDRTKWGEGGVAFIRNKQDKQAHTLSRAYLITLEQFIDVVRQENRVETIAIDFKALFKEGSVELTEGWYNKLLVAGYQDDLPVLTFTSHQDWPIEEEKAPSFSYEETLLNGLAELGLTKPEAKHYLTSHYPDGDSSRSD
ncbi:hypothetical protein [Shouchella lehensis]|uniref:Histone deacetylase n=2 Tax=Shouchella lehensis TaxID=300825 RepID=A0A060M1C8_9BACI|nr:hypothetical protein [Shouchella lehensis]AIC95830.1 hypothetical protein BleG1_3283 [Shouchella lehensis G1]MBG9784803.1 hypothetical protein [Shouchella lehensis]RQW18491.1 hypothetical protein EH196_16025 [Bacillus sp. C1-1]TES46210.1 hypothetical protein E2L03_15985 [Shouchella lehensis]